MLPRSPLLPRKAKVTPGIAAFHDWVRSMPCLQCGASSTLHHVTGHADRAGRFTPDHCCVVPLCGRHHQVIHGPTESVEALNHRGFFDTYGIDLEAEGDRLFAEWVGQRRAA